MKNKLIIFFSLFLFILLLFGIRIYYILFDSQKSLHNDQNVTVQSGTDGESLELVEVSMSDKGKLLFNVKRLYLTEKIVPDVELKQSLEEYYNIINVPFKLKN